MDRILKIGSRRIGQNKPTYIIAEMSANHNQDYEQAVKIIHAAKDAGADAIKLQTYKPETLTIDSKREEFLIKSSTPWDGQTLFELYGKAYMPWEWQPKLKNVADEIGIDLFSTAFDESSVKFLEDLDIPAFKIASFENTDTLLIEAVARTGKPMIISTGMATLEEIEEALDVAKKSGAKEIALLKCTSAYPSPPEEINLLNIPFLADRFNVPVGLSDHTMGISIPIAAVALDACIVEKHFTLSRSIEGPDSSFSLEPGEFKAMVDGIREAEQAKGQQSYKIGTKEKNSRIFRRSLFVVEDIKKGEVFSTRNVRSIRPGYGLHPRHLKEVLGSRAAYDIKRGTPLEFKHVSKK